MLIALENDLLGKHKVSLSLRTTFTTGPHSNTVLGVRIWVYLLTLWYILILVIVVVPACILLLLDLGFENDWEVVITNTARAHSRLLHI